MKALTFKRGGIHVPENKYTSAETIITVPLPMKVYEFLKQHIGAPADAIVKKGDKVVRGQKIAEAHGRVSAPVHASISGTVTDICNIENLTGFRGMAIVITASEEDHQADEKARTVEDSTFDWQTLTPEDVIATIADAGIVGLGGATFPCAMKLTPPKGCEANLLIINAAECEPFLTCDDALIRHFAHQIIEGIKILMHASRVPRAVIGIEDNKPQALRALESAIGNSKEISVQTLRTKYPQGGEKQLINAITGLEVPSGGLPINVGVIVQNVATAYAVYKALALRTPLIEKVITVAGYGNYLVPIGMKLNELPIECETLDTADVVIGGPMMGKSSPSIDAPIEKSTSGVTILSDYLKFDPDPCIRCAECVNACPMGLQPYLISTFGRLLRINDAVDNGALDCIECGSCNYSCPSKRPILDYIRLAKKLKRK